MISRPLANPMLSATEAQQWIFCASVKTMECCQAPLQFSIGLDETLLIMVIAIIFLGKDLPMIFNKMGSLYFKLKTSLQKTRDEIVSQINTDMPENNGTDNKKNSNTNSESNNMKQ